VTGAAAHDLRPRAFAAGEHPTRAVFVRPFGAVGPKASPLHRRQHMSEPRKLRCYEYIDRPYEQVRVALHERARETLQRATSSGARRGDTLLANLQTEALGITLGVDVRVHAKEIRDEESVCGLAPVTTVVLTWQADRLPGLFPSMSAELSASPLASDETQLLFEGEYRPPLGAVGKAADAAALHRVAEASVHQFLREVVHLLRRDVPQQTR